MGQAINGRQTQDGFYVNCLNEITGGAVKVNEENAPEDATNADKIDQNDENAEKENLIDDLDKKSGEAEEADEITFIEGSQSDQQTVASTMLGTITSNAKTGYYSQKIAEIG